MKDHVTIGDIQYNCYLVQCWINGENPPIRQATKTILKPYDCHGKIVLGRYLDSRCVNCLYRTAKNT